MARLITRADGNFTDTATWSPVATNMMADGSSSTVISTSNVDSSAFTLPVEEIDAILIKIVSVSAALVGNLLVTLRRTSGGGSPVDVQTVTIDATILPTNTWGWIIVPITPHTPSGADTYVVRLSRSSSSGGSLTVYTVSGTNIARAFRRTTTAAPASGDQLIMCGEYTGSTTLNARTITMDNTATTTFGAVVATYQEALFIGMGGKLTWANSSSTNYYLRFKGIFRIAGSGILEMYTATSGAGSLPSTSTAVLEMDCTAAGDTSIALGITNTGALQGGTWTLNGQIKGTTGTITGATNATPIVITETGHGLETGAGVVIESVGGNTAANGTWWIRKIDANSYSLDNSTGNGTYTSGGTRTSRMASKMQEVTTIGTDTVSMGCLVDANAAGTTLTWKEGQKFDTGWTGKVAVNGVVRTISSVPSTISMITTTSVGASLVAGTLIKLDTGAPKTMKLGDTGFIAAGDILQVAASSARSQDSAIGLVTSVDSATQVTLDNTLGDFIVKVTNGSTSVTLQRGQVFQTSGLWNSATCTINGNAYTISSVTNAGVLVLTGNYSQSSDDFAVLQITDTSEIQQSAYASGLHDTSTGTGDCRAEVVNISRNVMVRSLGQAGNTSGLFGLIHIYSTDAVVTWNYGEFSLLGSSTGSSVGVYITTNSLGSVNVKYCSFHDFWGNGTAVCLNFANATGGHNILNNTFTNIVNGIVLSATTGTTVTNGNIFIQLSGIAMNYGDLGGTFSYNTIACCSVASTIRLVETNTLLGTNTNNTLHSSAGSPITFHTGTYGEVKRLTAWRLIGSIFGAGFNVKSPITQLVISDLIAFGASATYLLALTTGGSKWILLRPILNAGVNIVSLGAFTTTANGQVTIKDGQIGVTNNFSTACFVVTATTPSSIIDCYNTTFGGTIVSGFTSAGVGLNCYISSIKHNGVSGDNRVYLPYGPNASHCLITDTSIYNTSSPSLRCYPGSATQKVQLGPFYVPVKSGVNPTISVAIRKSATGSGDSASYNGNQPRVALIANSALGYSVDTTITSTGPNYSAILATCSGAAGSWETLTFTLPTAPTGDGVVAIAIDFDGTTGWINVDDFKNLAPSTYGTGFWYGDFAGPVIKGNPAQFCLNAPRKMNKVVAKEVKKHRKFNPAIFAGTGFVSVSGSFLLNIENLLGVSSTSILGVESTLAASNTLVVSIEELLQVLNTLQTSNEHTITTSSALVANIEDLLGVSSTTVVNEESKIALSQTLITNEENTLGVSKTTQLNDESILGVSQTNVLNEENKATASKDVSLNEENILSTSKTEELPNEHLLATNQTLQMSIEELLGVSTAEIVNVEWAGTANSVSALIELHIENVGSVMQTNALNVEYLLQVTKLMSVAQVEQLLQANGNVSVNFECRSVIQSGIQLNLEVLATVTQTEIITLEQLFGVYNTEALSVEMLAKLSQIEIIPVEWDGVSGFVDGNELKWAISEQGVVWTLKGDQPTWLIKSNGRTYIIKR